ncbi:hypothetical protein RI844_20185 [Thalassotalea fonticola]|uniref:DUF2721 domain-containing protein n=1 Tax=Thalassotalea fonticola TaxID=3065649 RepID=A0ABZ0GPG9_9GAMM|nr:hypothetical protein RI844_20185 [Colwelliaceae bacterium S1-1]
MDLGFWGSITSILAFAIMVFSFVYSKVKKFRSKIKQHDLKLSSLEEYVKELMSQATNDTKRNEIYPYINMLSQNQAQFAIQLRLRYNLIAVAGFLGLMFAWVALIFKVGGFVSYQENPAIFVLSSSLVFLSIGIILVLTIFQFIIRKVENEQIAINDTCIQFLGNELEQKYLNNKN